MAYTGVGPRCEHKLVDESFRPCAPCRVVYSLHAALCGRWPHDMDEACANENEAHRLFAVLDERGLIAGWTDDYCPQCGPVADAGSS